MQKPRMTRCGHSFCYECLERKLKVSSIENFSSKQSNFKCPRPDCSREFTLPDLSMENFSPCLDLEQMIETEKLRNKESVCQKHSEVCSLFCLDCKRELCVQCVEEHDGHKFRPKNKVIQFYLEICKEKLQIVKEKYIEIKTKKEDVQKMCELEEIKSVNTVEKTLELFNWAVSKTQEGEISSMSKILQEQEFSSPSRPKMELDKRSRGIQHVNQILKPIISNPGKNVMEPVLVLELAEHTLKRAEQAAPIQNIKIQLIKPFSDSKETGGKFLDSLQKSLKFENYLWSQKVSSHSAGIKSFTFLELSTILMISIYG